MADSRQQPTPLRMGILGAAVIAPFALVNPARTMDDVAVTAIAARDPARAQTFAAKHGIPTVHAGYDALLADPEIDAVYVPLPNNLHAAWSIKALEAGKHVLCEKPMAANGDEARAMARAADATGLALIEAFHYRYHPLAVRAREIVRSGELGAVQHIDAEFCTPSVRPHNIRFRYDLAGGATMDLGCYAIDMIRFLSGEELTVVDAQAKTASPQIDRAMRARFTLTSGATAAMLVSMRSSCVLRALIRVVGERGTMTVINMLLPHFLYHRLAVKTPDGSYAETFPKTSTYTYQLRAFVEHLRGGVPMSSTVGEGVKNMAVIDAVYTAAGLQPRGT
ncbi:MAG: Gfo/Idh/MocA family oxidoreductase [Caldilineaceae bacterium]|nr:Gfo/Idh/MocA family oxidoreductase [Caldilineaceae bacterium]